MTTAEMIAAGLRALRQHKRLLWALYALQLGVSLLFMFIVVRALSPAYAHRPLFARGVAGDDAALFLALRDQRPTLRALAWVGLSLAGAWALVSIYLAAGMLGAFAGRPFSATANARVGAFTRLAVVSAAPLAVAAALVALGFHILGPKMDDAIDLGLVTGRTLLGAAPGLALLVLTLCAIDHARVDLVAGTGGATRALGRAYALVLTRRAPLAHYLLYLAFWLAVSALFVALTLGRPFAGAVGGWSLFALRQLVAGGRFAARAVTSAGQVAYRAQE